MLCIKKISDILKHLPAGGETIAVFDWDQTISSEESGYGPRELGDVGTMKTLEDLHNHGIKTMVLTARAQERLFILALNQIVFGGGGVKGNALVTLIEKDKFKKKPENIIFVDNDEKNKDDVIKVFTDRPENLY